MPGAEAGNEKDPTTHKITASLEPLLDGYLCDLVLLLGRTKSLCMYVYTNTLIYIYIYSPTSISIPQNWRDMNQKHTSFHILPFSDLISCIYFGHLFLMARFFYIYDVFILRCPQVGTQFALITPETFLCQVLQLYGSEA